MWLSLHRTLAPTTLGWDKPESGFTGRPRGAQGWGPSPPGARARTEPGHKNGKEGAERNQQDTRRFAPPVCGALLVASARCDLELAVVTGPTGPPSHQGTERGARSLGRKGLMALMLFCYREQQVAPFRSTRSVSTVDQADRGHFDHEDRPCAPEPGWSPSEKGEPGRSEPANRVLSAHRHSCVGARGPSMWGSQKATEMPPITRSAGGAASREKSLGSPGGCPSNHAQRSPSDHGCRGGDGSARWGKGTSPDGATTEQRGLLGGLLWR